MKKKVLSKASSLPVLSPGLQNNLRLHDQIEIICRRFHPSIVLTLYEGHAWERCVWHAARSVNQEMLCAGYQHTILRRHSHAVKRSLHPGRTGYDPDIVLTMGEVTRRMLDKSPRLKNVTKVVYGTHRRPNSGTRGSKRMRVPAFLVLPEGIETESIHLFDLALTCAGFLPEVRFIFRMHPVLPFDKIAPRLTGWSRKGENVELSDRSDIEEDFRRTGYILYRGSSAVMHAILAGLKPYYYERPDEMSFDPIFEMTTWRETVRSPEELVRKYKKDRQAAEEGRVLQWKEAFAYCDRYTRSIQESALEEMISLSVKNG